MSRSVKATDTEAGNDEQITFRLLQARHRAALRTLAKSRGLSPHALAREMLEGSLDHLDKKEEELSLLRLEMQELRGELDQMQGGLIQVLAGLMSLTPNAKGERMNLTEAKKLVRVAFGESGD